MSETFDAASVEAKIISLSSTAMLVLSLLPDSKSDADIVRWSQRWKFTPEQIDQSLEQIYRTFGIAGECRVAKRQQAAELYRSYQGSFRQLRAQTKAQTAH